MPPAIDPIKAAAALALHDAGYRPTSIANKTGISRPTIYDIVRRHGKWGEIADGPVFNALRQDQNRTLEAAFRAAAVESLELAHSPEKLEKASYYQLVIGSGIELDKSRLLAGESTANIAVAHHVEVEDLNEAADRIAHSLLRFSQAGRSEADPTASINQESDLARIEDVSEGEGK